jgi:hypothetical protein
MIAVDVYVDPTCPWAWVTSRWLRDVAPHRGLALRWRSYCLEMRDGYELPAGIAEHLRQPMQDGRALGHRMLRIFEAARASDDDPGLIDRLYTEWGRRYIPGYQRPDSAWLAEAVESAGGSSGLLDAGEDEKWDEAIAASMEVACAYGGPKTQTPVVVIADDPPRGFKGPVMATAPSGDVALQVWDALDLLSRQADFFEIARPRTSPPKPELPD